MFGEKLRALRESQITKKTQEEVAHAAVSYTHLTLPTIA